MPTDQCPWRQPVEASDGEGNRDWTGCPWVLESRALRGAVAQLGERRVRNAKVEGSIPFRSTIFLPPRIKSLAPIPGSPCLGTPLDGYDWAMLTIGARAPEFTLPDADGQATSLSNLLRDGPVILYFYPADFTPGCTREACQMRDLYGEVDAARLRLAGISPQSPESHRSFREKYKLPFTLLSDVDRFVIKMYGVQGPLGFGVRRATLLIDQARHIQDAVVADFRIGEHEAFVRKAIALSAHTR
jgi:thioredoxin-dependent peroxiredoxin